jgi:hypothetical protein
MMNFYVVDLIPCHYVIKNNLKVILNKLKIVEMLDERVEIKMHIILD